MGSLIRPTVGGERARGEAGVSGEASGANTPHICHIIFGNKIYTEGRVNCGKRRLRRNGVNCFKLSKCKL